MPNELAIVTKRSRTIRITQRTGFVFDSEAEDAVASAGAGGSGRLSRNRFGKRYSRRGRPLCVSKGGDDAPARVSSISGGAMLGLLPSTSIMVHEGGGVVETVVTWVAVDVPS